MEGTVVGSGKTENEYVLYPVVKALVIWLGD